MVRSRLVVFPARLRFEIPGGRILPSSRVGPEASSARATLGTGFSRVRRYCLSISEEGWVMRWARSPSFVRMSSPVVSASRRPAGISPGPSGIRGAPLGRPRSSFLVVREPRRFVQGQVDFGLREANGAAVEPDLICGRYGRTEGCLLAVYRDAALEYGPFGLAAGRRRAGPGEERLQPHYEGSLAASGSAAEARRSRTRESSSCVTSESTGGKSTGEEAPVAEKNSSVTPRRAGEPGASWSVPTSVRRPRSIRLRITASEFTPRTRETAPRVSGPRYSAQARTSWAAPESGAGLASCRKRSTA